MLSANSRDVNIMALGSRLYRFTHFGQFCLFSLKNYLWENFVLYRKNTVETLIPSGGELASNIRELRSQPSGPIKFPLQTPVSGSPAVVANPLLQRSMRRKLARVLRNAGEGTAPAPAKKDDASKK